MKLRSVSSPAMTVLFLVECSCLLLAGCGGSDGLQRVAVSGSVSVGGEPVSNGVIRFVPSEGTEGPMASAMITDGSYSIDREQGPVPGNYEVQVHAYADPYATAGTPPGDKLGPKVSSDDEAGTEDSAPKESKRTFNTTIPPEPSFEQDFTL